MTGPLLAASAAELALQAAVRLLRRDFKWLLTAADELPSLDAAALDKFAAGSFDPELGWTRKPGTSGVENGREGPVSWSVDVSGSRANPHAAGRPPSVAVFGDSYAFARQVDDGAAWPAQLSRDFGRVALNYGVGNYGADQALLRLERTELPASVDTVILAFVPETICRVQSCWKHYLEFGNTFAFKPRFRLNGGALALEPCPVRSRADFDRLGELLPDLRARDRFYDGKFRPLQFRFPFLWTFLRAPRRHGETLGWLLARAAARAVGARSLEERPFASIMSANIRDAQDLYRDAESRALLRAILLRFKAECERRAKRPLVLVLPQLIDLERIGGARDAVAYFRALSAEIPLLDLTETLAASPDRAELYVADAYGGHFSAAGNAFVAARVAEAL